MIMYNHGMSTRFLTVEEFAERLNIGVQSIRRSIRAGRIHACRVSIGIKAPYRIPETEIERIQVMSYQETIKHLKDK